MINVLILSRREASRGESSPIFPSPFRFCAPRTRSDPLTRRAVNGFKRPSTAPYDTVFFLCWLWFSVPWLQAENSWPIWGKKRFFPNATLSRSNGWNYWPIFVKNKTATWIDNLIFYFVTAIHPYVIPNFRIYNILECVKTVGTNSEEQKINLKILFLSWKISRLQLRGLSSRNKSALHHCDSTYAYTFCKLISIEHG